MPATDQIKSYRDLRVWQRGMDLVEEVYLGSAAFPRSETYGLTSQMRRAAISTPANIAEGYGRDATGSYLQFLRIAKGSLRELETHLLLSRRLNLLNETSWLKTLGAADDVGRMLTALIRSVEASTRDEQTTSA